MKIGVFDSGLGGLLILRTLSRKLPEYDYVYLGDTRRVPYGNRSQADIFQFLKEAVDYLFKKDCELIIVACNTASAEALRKIQQRYVSRKRVLGVIIPTVEAALEYPGIRRIGVLATQATVRSRAYEREIKKIAPAVKVFQIAAPLLVPVIEHGGREWAEPILQIYVKPLMQKKVQAIILGCTHYPALKKEIRKICGVPVVSQDEIIAGKLKKYLQRHPEIDARLSKRGKREFLLTKTTQAYEQLSRKWFGQTTKLKEVVL